MKISEINFPEFSGIRCLMMPYIQGEPESVPQEYQGYGEILADVFIERGAIGFLTIDESAVKSGSPHRGDRAKYGRACKKCGRTTRETESGHCMTHLRGKR